MSAGILSILFVDEDSSLRLLFGDALRAAGHKVETAAELEAAQSLLKQQSFDVVITDVRAPQIDGLTLLKDVRRDRPNTEVLLTTFRPGVPEAAFALAEGAADYLIKPFDLDDAVLRVQRLMREKQARENAEPFAPDEAWVLLVCEEDERCKEIAKLISESAIATSVDRIKKFSDAHTRLRRRGRNLIGDSHHPAGPRHDAIVVVLPLSEVGELDAVLELQSLAPELPLVVIGPAGDETLAMRTVQVGAQEFLGFDELDTRHLGRAVRFAIERKRSEQRLVYLAHHDHLTGLANRLLFRERLSHARARSRRDKRKLAMMFLDLDRFKAINDSLGHETGDALLREVAKRLRHAVRDQDTVARLGGDEFAVLLEDVADKKEAAVIAQRVLETVKEPIHVDREQLMVTTSIGIAVSPEVWDTTGDLVSSADEAMYLAKERGRDNYFMFGDERSRSKAENDLRLALERNEFVLHYQPLMSVATQTVVGTEALLRWQRPGGAIIQPADFIPFLEESGLIVPVGAHVLDMACGQAARWRNAGVQGKRISVNLSAVQLDRDDLPATVIRSIDRAGISPDALQLEITESVLMRDTARAQATLASLKSRGVRIAIDDFGTGYSSLAYIHRFPVDTVKIDRTFVRQITAGGAGAAIVGAIIGLAHKLKMEVVAEGVETEEELAFLREEGCDLVQGFLAGRPEPASSLALS